MEKYINVKNEMQEKNSHLAEMEAEVDMQLEFLAMMQSESKNPQPTYIELEAEVKYLREQLAAKSEELNEQKAFLHTVQAEMQAVMKEVVGWRDLAKMQTLLISNMKECEEKRTQMYSAFFDHEHAPTKKQTEKQRGGFRVFGG